MNPKVGCLLLIGCFATMTLLAEETREPKISLKQSVQIAEKHVSAKKIDTSGLFMSSIYRSEFPNDPKQNRWTIIWSPKADVLDGELIIYVYDDGHILRGSSS